MNETIRVQLAQKQDYQFDIFFGGDVPVIMGDEPAPLGQGIPVKISVMDSMGVQLK